MGLLATATNAFPLWLILASALALWRPASFTWFSGPLIPLGLGLIMLSMGMTVGFEDFRRIVRERANVLPGVALQYTLMPLLGLTLGLIFGLPAPFAVGLILVSCCPGGTASNVIAFIARADVALSVAMTTASTLLAAFATPALTALLAGNRIDVPVVGLLTDTVQVVILPVAAGALLKARFPRACDRVLPVAPLVAVLAIILIAGSVIAGNREAVIDAGPRLLPGGPLPPCRRLRARLYRRKALASQGTGGPDGRDRGRHAELGPRRRPRPAELHQSPDRRPQRHLRRPPLPGRERRRRPLARAAGALAA